MLFFMTSLRHQTRGYFNYSRKHRKHCIVLKHKTVFSFFCVWLSEVSCVGWLIHLNLFCLVLLRATSVLVKQEGNEFHICETACC